MKWQRLAVAVAATAVAALRLATRARLPDDWDSVGFVAAVERFDLTTFQPHFPGYPVYVALTRVAHALGLSPLDAATSVSAVASAATAAALWRLGAALVDARAGFVALALWAGALEPWLVGGAALSDATATAFAVGAFAALTFEGAPAALLAGAAMALAVGTRASYWPLALSFAVVVARAWPRHRRAVAIGGVLSTAGWLVPFVSVVGLRPLFAAGRTQLSGHFAEWGGAVTTRPDVGARVAAFARDLLYDGLWAHLGALVPALLLVALLLLAPRPRLPPQARAVAAIIVVPYGLWALLAQNVIAQPRHLLPLIAASVLALGCAAARRPWVGAALAVAAFAASTGPMASRAQVPPAAVQVARALAAAHPLRDEAVVFGARSARLMALAAPSLHVATAARVSEVLGALERFDVLPRHIYVTSELVDDDPAQLSTADDRLQRCRDRRLDRQSPCLALRSYSLRQ